MNRKLEQSEIEELQNNGCTAKDWNRIVVHPKFDPSVIKNVNFSGDIELGYYDKSVTLFGSMTYETGIRNATIHNCKIGNNVLIDQINNYISNYIIYDNVIIKNTDIIATEPGSGFGNGVMVETLNESGGRKIPIYDKLSAQLAYTMVIFRHKEKMVDRCQQMIREYSENYKSKKGRIEEDTVIMDCNLIKNVWIGPYAKVEGVKNLTNGKINSTESSPVTLGQGLVADDFIISPGASLKDDVIISETFIGQGVKMERQFSSENSLFFANCEGYHGEACSIFAGPFTVSHHKSTLLIAGMFSFCNAGSGSNQSNHMYKLGPNHQGIVERGSKTASDSYMLWPMKVGPFSLIMGRHYQNSDTSDLPFSYLFEGDNESLLIPGVNFTSVGTIRDAMKWPNRDRRGKENNLDLINFDLLSPFTIQKMMDGKKILQDLKKTTGVTSDYYYYNNVKIKRGSLERGIKYYDMGLKKYLGDCIVRRLEDFDFSSIEEFYQTLRPDSQIGQENWLDISGMLAPEESILELLQKIESEELDNLESINKEFKRIHNNYHTYEWNWAADRIEQLKNKQLSEINIDEFIDIIKEWRKNVVKLDNMLKDDAKKEFSRKSQVGYGYDNSDKIRKKDFANVMGEYESNQFIAMINDHIERKESKSQEIIDKLASLKNQERS